MEPHMVLKCCLLRRGIVLPKNPIFCCIFVSKSTFMSICALFIYAWSIFLLPFPFFHFHYFFFIFITIKDIISMTQTNLFFRHVCQNFSLRVYFFCNFQHGVTYKSVGYKKACVTKDILSVITSNKTNWEPTTASSNISFIYKKLLQKFRKKHLPY